MQLSAGTSEKILRSMRVLKTFPGFSGGFVQCLHGSCHIPEHQSHPGEAAAPRSDTQPLVHIDISAPHHPSNNLLLLSKRKPRCKWFFQGPAFLSPTPRPGVPEEQSLNSEVTVEMWWPGASPAPAADLMVPGMLYSHSWTELLNIILEITQLPSWVMCS